MKETTELRDEPRMIASILAGDSHLFHELIRPYGRSVYMMALSFLKNEADAEDAAQEAFLKAYRIPSLRNFHERRRGSCLRRSVAHKDHRGNQPEEVSEIAA